MELATSLSSLPDNNISKIWGGGEKSALTENSLISRHGSTTRNASFVCKLLKGCQDRKGIPNVVRGGMLDKLESNRNIRTFASFCLKRVQLLFKVKNLLRQLGNKIRKPAITGSR